MLSKNYYNNRTHIKDLIRFISTTQRNFRKIRNRTHYDILNLKKNCNQKEIRDAFITLSKELHPDINKGQNSSENFARLNEAYNTLRNPIKRRDYDFRLEHGNTNPHRVIVSDRSFWENRDRSQDEHYRKKPYYGVPGLRRASNSTIVLLCIAFVTVGVSVQFAVLNYEWMLRQNRIDKVSKLNGEILLSVRREAEQNGNDAQLEKLRRGSRMYTQNITGFNNSDSSEDY